MLNIGDIVALRSGGPEMTVVIQLKEDEVGCYWFVKEELQHGVFGSQSLVVLNGIVENDLVINGRNKVSVVENGKVVGEQG